jgi:DNA polymerase-3 subunit alpha (Gram-positive type)
MIRMLFDLTEIDPTKVPLDDKETMSIFSSTKALGVTPEQIRSEVGSYRSTRIWNKICKRNAC